MTAGRRFRLTALLVLTAFSSQSLDAQQMPRASIQTAPAADVSPVRRPLFPPRTIGDHVILGMFAGAAVTGVGPIIAYERYERVRGFTPRGDALGAAIILGLGISAGGVAGLITALVRDLD